MSFGSLQIFLLSVTAPDAAEQMEIAPLVSPANVGLIFYREAILSVLENCC